MGSEAIEIAVSLWHHFNDKNWNGARHLLDDAFEATWLQSKELIKGPNNFIELNRTYPGTHRIEVTNALHYEDRWEFVDHVVTEVLIQSTAADGKETALFAISFFEIQNEKIMRLREYWADSYPAPEWRSHLVEPLK